MLLALLFGVSAAVLISSILSGFVKTAEVVIAKRDVEAYKRISPSDIKLVQMPVMAVSSNNYSSVEEVVGLYTKTRLVAGQMLLKGHMSTEQGRMADNLPYGLRAIFLPSSQMRAMGGLVKSGDVVDVIWARKGVQGYVDHQFVPAATVLTNAPVIEVIYDSNMVEIRGIVILANPNACEGLAYYLENGSVYLTLVPTSEVDGYMVGEVD